MRSVSTQFQRLLQLYYTRYIRINPEMELCSFILLFAIISNHRTTAIEFTRDNYVGYVSDGTLLTLEETGNLDLSDLGIKRFYPGVLDNLNVKKLNLADNNITRIPKFLFSNLTGLEELSLANNKIKLQSGIFIGLNNLRVLDLQNTGLRELGISSLYGIPKSALVMVKGNWLRTVYSTSFEPPILSEADALDAQSKKSIRNDHSGYGPEIKICETDNGTLISVSISTSGQTVCDDREYSMHLVGGKLDLSFSFLTKVQFGWWQLEDDQVDSLDLSYNILTEITPELLNELPDRVYSVKIRENSITTIKRNVINNSHITELDLTFNLISTIEDGAFENTHLEVLILNANNLKNLDFAKTLPTSIYHLELNRIGITKIPDNSFTHLESLRKLLLAGNEICDLAVGAFQGLKSLYSIDVSINHLENIEPGTFDNLESLSQIILAFNNIKEIDARLFSNVSSLNWLDLRKNDITNISKNTFSGLRKKRFSRMDLSSNKINFIEEGSFANMAFDQLILNYNKITEESIAKGAFNETIVMRLHLHGNLMTTINGESFYGISNVQSLTLSANQIKSIKKGAAKYLSSVDELDLLGNPLEILESGALNGLSKKKNVKVCLIGVPLKVIHADVFDDE